MAHGYKASGSSQGNMTIKVRCRHCNSTNYVDGNKARSYACVSCGKDL